MLGDTSRRRIDTTQRGGIVSPAQTRISSHSGRDFQNARVLLVPGTSKEGDIGGRCPGRGKCSREMKASCLRINGHNLLVQGIPIGSYSVHLPHVSMLRPCYKTEIVASRLCSRSRRRQQVGVSDLALFSGRILYR